MNTAHTPSLDDITGRVDSVFTLPEVADVLRIQPRTLRKYIGNGAIPSRLYSRLGGNPKGRLRFTADQVRELAIVWSGVEGMAPAQRQTTSPYRPRRTGRGT